MRHEPKESDPVADSLDRNLTSLNELDSNLEAANVVDGLFAIARGLNHVAEALEKLGKHGEEDTPAGSEEGRP